MKLNKVLGIDAGHVPVAAPVINEAPAPATKLTAEDNPFESGNAAEAASEEDDTLSYFAKLAKES